jgi:hypothetical protein
MASEFLHTPATDFSLLRQEGIALLQRLASDTWTDHNTHDPGITILEQLCYALTDLSYRTEYQLPDLLSHDGEEAYASLYSSAQILPTRPVTLLDLRKQIIDVVGVRNAWIELVDEVSLSFKASAGEVSLAIKETTGQTRPNVTEFGIKGLLRVLIEMSDETIGGCSEIPRKVMQRLHQRLHQCRGLGQDFTAIKICEPQDVDLRAVLEIDPGEDPIALLVRVYQSIKNYMSPSVAFHTLDEMLQRGQRMDEIFDGPRLKNGFIDTDELSQAERRTTLRISDLIQVLMTVPGVVAVKDLRFLDTQGKPIKEWVLKIDADKTPRLNLQPRADQFVIQLEKNAISLVRQDMQMQAIELFKKRAQLAPSSVHTTFNEHPVRPQPGRDRNVANYTSIQHQFPAAYGIGATGLPQSASPERKAMAKQLKAYLMFFDQLLANQYAQLANVGRLFSFHDESTNSYFSQPVQDDGTLGLDEIRIFDPQTHRKTLGELTEDPSLESDDKPDAHRRNRFLDHLLARFGEPFYDNDRLPAPSDSTEGVTPDKQASAKRAFLRDYPRIGADRGGAFNYLEPADDDNISGLERTLRHKLGINDANDAKKRFYLIEHILLRPIPGDEQQTGPLLRGAQASDPYSLQITLVFPTCLQGDNNQTLVKKMVEKMVREETPAHLTVYIVWKDESAMSDFASAHGAWLQRWREHRLKELGLESLV